VAVVTVIAADIIIVVGSATTMVGVVTSNVPVSTAVIIVAAARVVSIYVAVTGSGAVTIGFAADRVLVVGTTAHVPHAGIVTAVTAAHIPIGNIAAPIIGMTATTDTGIAAALVVISVTGTVIGTPVRRVAGHGCLLQLLRGLASHGCRHQDGTFLRIGTCLTGIRRMHQSLDIRRVRNHVRLTSHAKGYTWNRTIPSFGKIVAQDPFTVLR